jgi:hypothetical protein
MNLLFSFLLRMRNGSGNAHDSGSRTDMVFSMSLRIFFASSVNNAPNWFVVSLLKPENPKSQRKSTTDGNGQNLHHFVVPCNFYNNFHILQTHQAHQVLEPLRSTIGEDIPTLDGAAGSPSW